MNYYSQELFIATWNGAHSPQQVADAFAISRQSACNRASLLRKAGIPLKHFQNHKQYKVHPTVHLILAQADIDRAEHIGDGDLARGLTLAVRKYGDTTL